MKKNKTNTTQTKNNLSPFGENILGQLKDSIFARNPEISDRESLERICLKMQRDIKKDQKIGHEVNTKYLKAIREYLFSVYKYYYSSYWDLGDKLDLGLLLGFCKDATHGHNFMMIWMETMDYSDQPLNEVEPVFEEEGLLETIKKDIASYLDDRCSSARFFFGMLQKEKFEDKIIDNVKANLESYDNSNKYWGVDVDCQNTADLSDSNIWEEEECYYGRDVSDYHNAGDLCDRLKTMVFGQDEALKQISIMANIQLKRLDYPEKDIQKLNYMLIGEPGSGKTEITRALKKYLPMPVITLNCSQCVPDGWKGVSVLNMLSAYSKQYANDPLFSHSIIVLDEFDKLINKANESCAHSYGQQIQADLLKIVEGGDIHVGKPSDPGGQQIINTTNMAFLFVGSFDDALNNPMYNSSLKYRPYSKKKPIELDDLQIRKIMLRYGLIPELLGRIGNFTMVNKLTPFDFVQIFISRDNGFIDKYVRLFELDNVKFSFTKEALYECAKIAVERHEGVRGMQSLISSVLSDSLFMASAGEISEVVLNKKLVRDALSRPCVVI